MAPLPDSPPIRFGILGAATIAPIALLIPAKNHPEAVVLAIAARDKARAEAYAKTYGIPKVYGGPDGYQGNLICFCDEFVSNNHMFSFVGRPRDRRHI